VPPRRRQPRRRVTEEPSIELPANVPAWIAKRGPDAVEAHLARNAERHQERVDELVDRAPPAVKREGKAAVQAWAEALADEPRLVPIDDRDPRAPLSIRRR